MYRRMTDLVSCHNQQDGAKQGDSADGCRGDVQRVLVSRDGAMAAERRERHQQGVAEQLQE